MSKEFGSQPSEDQEALELFDAFIHATTREQLDHEFQKIYQWLTNGSGRPGPEMLQQVIERYNALADLSWYPEGEPHFQVVYQNGVPTIAGIYYPNNNDREY